MKRHVFLCLVAFCTFSLCVAQNAHFCLKGGMKQTWGLAEIDSVTYVHPAAELTLPASCTLEAGTSAKLTYMVSDGLQDGSIVWGSTDGRVAYFREDYLYAKKPGKCMVYATYKGVTSSCLVTVTPSVVADLSALISYAPLATYSMAELGAYMSQALTTASKSQTGSYPYSSGWEFYATNGHPHWRLHCDNIMPTALRLLNDAEGKGYRNVQLIARTIRLMSVLMATDIYGEMPLQELGLLANPKFEEQQQIYEWMFDEVDQLLKLFADADWVNCSTNLSIDATLDPIYAGDLAKWGCFCKALKARLYLRKLPNWDNTPEVCQQIVRLVDDALIGWQEPRYYYPGGVKENNSPWGPYAPSLDGINANRLAYSIPTTFFLHGLLGSIDGRFQQTRGYALDPRATKMMDQRSYTYEGMLHLLSNVGMDISRVISEYPDLLTQSTQNNPFTMNTGYIALMTEEELMFIKAEAQFWGNDINGAYNTTVEAAKISMRRYGIMEEHLTDNALNQYKRFFEIKLPGAARFTLADLMQQKYVAMYLQPEQWTDMRRYNYSSSTNGIAYLAAAKAPVYVYDVKKVHNGANALFAKDAPNFCLEMSLDRPFNLYEPYWCTADNYGEKAKLSPNAWLMRINACETAFNLKWLERCGYYTTNASGETEFNHNILKKRMVWAQKNNAVVTCADGQIVWY